MYSGPQRLLLDRVLAAASGDPRIEAMLGAGSLAAGGFDAQSDFDLVVVGDLPVADRRAFAGEMGTLLSAFTGEHVGDPDLLICLYGSPLLHVDYKFAAPAELTRFDDRPVVLWARDPAATERWLSQVPVGRAVPDAQWFEDRAWLWLHYGATKWARGEFFEAISTLDFFRGMVLGPMLQRIAGRPMRGQRRLEQVPGAHEALLPTLASHDAKTIRRGLTEAAALYVELRQADPPPRPTPQMPEALLDCLRP
jgi:predicted nucleotidyltransferase